jgi:hypothetical protein
MSWLEVSHEHDVCGGRVIRNGIKKAAVAELRDLVGAVDKVLPWFSGLACPPSDLCLCYWHGCIV